MVALSYSQIRKRNETTQALLDIIKAKRSSKYHSQKIKVDGLTFDSKGEAKRYQELKLLQKNRIITGLELQKRIELQPSFTYNGKTERAINYVADFYYYDNEKGTIVIEDFKGFKTPEYLIKRKMLIKDVCIPNGYEFLESR